MNIQVIRELYTAYVKLGRLMKQSTFAAPTQMRECEWAHAFNLLDTVHKLVVTPTASVEEWFRAQAPAERYEWKPFLQWKCETEASSQFHVDGACDGLRVIRTRFQELIRRPTLALGPTYPGEIAISMDIQRCVINSHNAAGDWGISLLEYLDTVNLTTESFCELARQIGNQSKFRAIWRDFLNSAAMGDGDKKRGR